MISPSVAVGDTPSASYSSVDATDAVGPGPPGPSNASAPGPVVLASARFAAPSRISSSVVFASRNASSTRSSVTHSRACGSHRLPAFASAMASGVFATPRTIWRDAHGDADGGKDDGGRDAGAEAFEKTGRAARARADDGRGDERGGAAEDALADGLETAGDARRRVAGSSKRKDVVEVQLCPREVTGRSASERAAGEGWTSRKGGGRAMETGRGSTKRRTRDGNRSGFDEAADARWKPVGAGRTSPCASPEATLVGTPAYAVSARDASAITRSPAASPPLDDDGSDMPRAWTARRGKGGRARRDLAGGHLRATTRLVA